jgi:hypothetical protein
LGENSVLFFVSAMTWLKTGVTFFEHTREEKETVYFITIEKNGTESIKKMLDGMEEWMTRKRFERLSDFRGKMSQDKTKNPAIYDRVQFMRYFGGKKNVTP